MPTVGTVRAIFQFDTKEAQRSADNLSKKLKKNLQGSFDGVIAKGGKFSGVLGSMGPMGIAAGVGIGAAVIAMKKLLDVTMEFTRLGAKMVDMSSKTGLSTDALQKLGFAGEQVGLGMDVVADATTRLQRRIAEELPKAVKWLNQLGLEVEDIKAMKPEDAFRTIVSEIARMPNEMEQSAAAMGIFGDVGLRMLPLIRSDVDKTIEEFERLGGVLSEDLLKAGKKLDDQMTSLSAVWKSMKGEIAEETIPTLITFTETLLLLREAAVKVEEEPITESWWWGNWAEGVKRGSSTVFDMSANLKKAGEEARMLNLWLGGVEKTLQSMPAAPGPTAAILPRGGIGPAGGEDVVAGALAAWAKEAAKEGSVLDKILKDLKDKTDDVSDAIETLDARVVGSWTGWRNLTDVLLEYNVAVRDAREGTDAQCEEIETIVPIVERLNLEISQLTPGMKDSREATDEQTESFADAREEAAQFAGIMYLLADALGAPWLNALGAGRMASTEFSIGVKEMEEGTVDTIEGLQNLGEAALQMGAALWAATAEGTKGMRALKGAMTGAMMGAEVGKAFGPLGPAIGAAIGGIGGALIGFLRGGGVENQIRDIGRDMGVTITEELAKSIEESGRPAQLAIAAIFEEGAMGIDRFSEEIGDLFSVFERGEITKPELIAALETSIPLLIEQFNELGPAGQEQINRIISAAKSMGIEFEGLSDLIASTFAPDTLESMMEAFGMTNAEVRELADLLGIDVQTNLERMAASLGLSVEDFNKLGAAVSEKFGIPMDQIAGLLESMGITAEELATALGVDVAEGTGDVESEADEASKRLKEGADEAGRMADNLERAATAASGIGGFGGGEGYQHGTPPGGVLYTEPSLVSIAEKQPERLFVQPTGSPSSRGGGDISMHETYNIYGADDPDSVVQHIEANRAQSMTRLARKMKSMGVI